MTLHELIYYALTFIAGAGTMFVIIAVIMAKRNAEIEERAQEMAADLQHKILLAIQRSAANVRLQVAEQAVKNTAQDVLNMIEKTALAVADTYPAEEHKPGAPVEAFRDAPAMTDEESKKWRYELEKLRVPTDEIRGHTMDTAESAGTGLVDHSSAQPQEQPEDSPFAVRSPDQR